MSDASSPVSEPTVYESVAELIERLGKPPEDVWQRLLDEASGLPSTDEPDLSPESEFWLAHGLDGHGCLVELNPSEPTPLAADSDDTAIEVTSTETDTTTKTNRPARRSWRIPTAIAAGVIVISLIGWFWSSTDKKPTAMADASANNPPKTSSQSTRTESRRKPAMDVPSTEPFTNDSVELDNVVSQPATPATTVDFSSAAFSLDAMIPAPAPMDIPNSDSEMEPESDSNTDDKESMPSGADDASSKAASSQSASLGGERADVMSDENGEMNLDDAIDADTQAVPGQTSTIAFIELPTHPAKDDAITKGVSFDASDWSNVSLEFPHPSAGLSLVAPDGDRRQIVASESKTPIAAWMSDGETSELRWLPAAALENAARSLVHGRLKWSPERMVYLRPSLRADAIPIDLATRDLKLQWDLKAPPEPRQSRLSVRVRVPKEIDLGWIEPIDNESPRKVRGIAVLNLRDSESVAVVMRIDVQTTKRMSMRLRFGARLDPTMPWQWTDQQDIAATLAAVTNRLELGEMQNSELELAIDRADKLRARRTELRLTQQQDQLIAQQKRLQVFAERLVELDRLIANLAGQASVEAELFVSWPDSEQSLLRLISETP